MTIIYESVEVISLEDYKPTNNPDVFVKDNGEIATIIDADHVIVIKN